MRWILAGLLLCVAASVQAQTLPARLRVVSGAPSGGGGGGDGAEHGYTPTHYVAPHATVTGVQSNDHDTANSPIWSECTTRSNPCTAGRAMASAVAGNVVEFAEGDYVITNSEMGLNPQNSGTSGSPIIFTARYPAVSNLGDDTLWAELRAQGTGSRHIWSNNILTGANVSYIVVDGFRTYQGVDNEFDGGGHHVALHNNSGLSQYWKFRRMLLDQELYAPDGSVAIVGGDNYGAFWTQGTQHVEIADCIIRNFVGSGPNLTVWTTYGASSVAMHHTRIDTVSSGPYIKGSQASGWNSPLEFHHNFVINTRYANLVPNVVGEVDGTPFADVFQNVFVAESGFVFGMRSPGAPSSANPRSLRIINNTFVGETGAVLIGFDDGIGGIWSLPDITSGTTIGTEVYLRNNIINTPGSPGRYMGGTQATDDTGLARLLSDRNLISSNFENNFGAAGTASLADWRTTSGDETNSVLGSATFVNAAGEDYTLSGGSAGIDIGQDTLNLLGGGTSGAINAGAIVGGSADNTIGPRSNATINGLSLVWAFPFR